jgi:uncharacterized protein
LPEVKMFIDINEIDWEGIAFDERLDLSSVEGDGPEELRVLSARMVGRAVPGDVGVILTAKLEAAVELACSRCTEPIEVRLTPSFRLTLIPEAAEFAAGEARIEDEDASLFSTREGKADLSQIAAEQIYLELPLKPVCSEGCKGLCPRCGANRNRTDCGCVDESVDPRLAPLLQFRKRR